MAFPGPVPTAPNSGDPANFNPTADTFLGWMALFAAWLEEQGYPDFAAGVRAAPGSAAAPSLSFAGDSNTGLFSAGPDDLGFATGGVERLRLTAAGLLSSLTAIVTSQTDTTAGRLLTTGAGPAQAYRRGNILGAVSQVAGVPTGALIERGSNANGDFLRYADGLLVCVKLNFTDADLPAASGGDGVWTFPAPFIASTAVVTPAVSSLGTAAAALGAARYLRASAQSGGTTSAVVAWWNDMTGALRSRVSLSAIGRWY